MPPCYKDGRNGLSVQNGSLCGFIATECCRLLWNSKFKNSEKTQYSLKKHEFRARCMLRTNSRGAKTAEIDVSLRVLSILKRITSFVACNAENLWWVKFREKHRKNTIFTEKTRCSGKVYLVFQWSFAEGVAFTNFSQKAPISKSPYLEIDVSPDANSFEIGFLRLSAFQNGAFCCILTPKRSLKVDFELRIQNHQNS